MTEQELAALASRKACLQQQLIEHLFDFVGPQLAVIVVIE